MNELERDLTLLRDAVAWPQTPDVAAAVAARLAGSEGERPAAGGGWRARVRRRPRLALAALLVVLAGGLAVSPAARRAAALGRHRLDDPRRRGRAPAACQRRR